MHHYILTTVCVVFCGIFSMPCTASNEDAVRVRVEILKTAVSLGEPIAIRIIVINNSDNEIKIALFSDLQSNINTGTIEIGVRRDGGEWRAAGLALCINGEAAQDSLGPGEKFIIEGMVASKIVASATHNHGMQNHASITNTPGARHVKVYVAEYAIDQDKVVYADRPSNYESNIVTVDVTKPESPEAISASLVFLTGKIAESFDLGGISEDQLAKLEEVALSETDYAPYAGYLLAKHWRVQWQRERSKDRSISRISTDEQRWLKIADDDRFPLRSAVLMREQKIADRLGRKEEAEDIKREIVNVYPSSAAAQEIIQFHLVENID